MSYGAWIVFEGGEGCGKSTQARRLADRLGAVLTREPGGTVIGSRIRAITHDVSIENMSPVTEAFLMAADRAQHYCEVVDPALRVGRHVVADRSVYSSMAYQGFGRGLDPNWIWDLGFVAYQMVMPTTIVFMDVPDHVAVARRAARGVGDRFESAEAEFHRRVVDGFRRMADGGGGGRWVTVDGVGDVDEVEARVWAAVQAHSGFEFVMRHRGAA